MLDGKKFGSLHETGEDIASCELFLTPKVAPLISASLHVHALLRSSKQACCVIRLQLPVPVTFYRVMHS